MAAEVLPFESLHYVSVHPEDMELSVPSVVEALGYGENHIPEHFENLIHTIFSEVPQRIAVEAGFRILPMFRPEGSFTDLFVGDLEFHPQKIITGQLKKADYVAVFVCTIGPNMEKWSKEATAAGDMAMGYLINTAASHVVEAAMDVVHHFIEEQMSYHDLNITNRFSPGYCNWSVAEQHKLFSLLPEKFCGVTLTESALMTPIKSVSGFIGIGKNVRWRNYPCDVCTNESCIKKHGKK